MMGKVEVTAYYIMKYEYEYLLPLYSHALRKCTPSINMSIYVRMTDYKVLILSANNFKISFMC